MIKNLNYLVFGEKKEDRVTLLKKEHAELVVNHENILKNLEFIDSTDSKFDALCCELNAVNHRIDSVLKELKTCIG